MPVPKEIKGPLDKALMNSQNAEERAKLLEDIVNTFYIEANRAGSPEENFSAALVHEAALSHTDRARQVKAGTKSDMDPNKFTGGLGVPRF